jgi:hypothetical protein
MLSTVARLQGIQLGYKPTHVNHPCTKWVRASQANFEWTVQHGLALCTEYTLRYLRRHAAKDIIESIQACAFLLRFEQQKRTPFAQALPDQYRSSNAVTAYRRFYIGEKRRFAKWSHPSTPPDWWPEKAHGSK